MQEYVNSPIKFSENHIPLCGTTDSVWLRGRRVAKVAASLALGVVVSLPVATVISSVFMTTGLVINTVNEVKRYFSHKDVSISKKARFLITTILKKLIELPLQFLISFVIFTMDIMFFFTALLTSADSFQFRKSFNNLVVLLKC